MSTKSGRTVQAMAAALVVAVAGGVVGWTAAQTQTLDDLAWMAGYWVGSVDGVVAEELWLEPRGAFMIGVHRDSSARGDAFFEYLRIQRTPSGIVYLASPAGRDPTPFPLTTLEDRRVVFENPDHDFPQRITYWLDETGALHARVEGDVNGDTRTDEWVWQRTTLPAP